MYSYGLRPLALADSMILIQMAVALASTKKPIFSPNNQAFHIAFGRIITQINRDIIENSIKLNSIILSIDNGFTQASLW